MIDSPFRSNIISTGSGRTTAQQLVMKTQERQRRIEERIIRFIAWKENSKRKWIIKRERVYFGSLCCYCFKLSVQFLGVRVNVYYWDDDDCTIKTILWATTITTRSSKEKSECFFNVSNRYLYTFFVGLCKFVVVVSLGPL